MVGLVVTTTATPADVVVALTTTNATTIRAPIMIGRFLMLTTSAWTGRFLRILPGLLSLKLFVHHHGRQSSGGGHGECAILGCCGSIIKKIQHVLASGSTSKIVESTLRIVVVGGIHSTVSRRGGVIILVVTAASSSSSSERVMAAVARPVTCGTKRFAAAPAGIIIGARSSFSGG